MKLRTIHSTLSNRNSAVYYGIVHRSGIVIMIAYSDFLQGKVNFMYNNNQTLELHELFINLNTIHFISINIDNYVNLQL